MQFDQTICIGSGNSLDGSGLSNNLLEGAEEELDTRELEEKLAAGKWEQTGSDPAEAEASDVHWVCYPSWRPN